MLMKGGSEAIFSVMLQKHGCYVASSDWNKQHTDLDFLPGAETHAGGTAIPATSLPPRGHHWKKERLEHSE